MRVLLTGAGGFIGSAVLERLVAAGIPTAVLLRPTTNVWRIESLLDRVSVIQADMSDLRQVQGSIRAFAPDSFLHLAWEGVLNRDRNNLAQTNNLFRSLDLVRLCAEVGAKTWIGLGSQAEYGLNANRVDERSLTRPTTLYGVTKLAACMLAERICEELKVRFAWLRIFSTYGPKDNPSWMIPSLIDRLARGVRPALTEGRQLWDYLYVSDAAEAIYRVLASDSASGVFNLGSGTALALREIVQIIRDMVAPGAELGFGEVPYRLDQVMHLEANIRRLQEATGWAPSVPMSEGLARTVEWYVGR